ncbi:hypothetical protein [Streptomyces sp. NPDC001068]|uniref:hypothetical protein n=1 Tax=Streptomyces sp. NPDC001068 TaxID=3364544 RepID=UPI0036C0222F
MRGRGPVLCAAATALLLAGCTDGGQEDGHGGEDGRGTPVTTASASGSASPGASAAAENEPFTLAEAVAPRTRAEAAAFVRGLAVQPEYFGTGFRRRDPYELGPTTWAVLGDDCLWRREPVPATVPASLTRSFVRPAAGGKGAVYVSVTVTVHSSTLQARRDMASSLEEPLRCPRQRLNATDTVEDMSSRGDPYTEQRTATSDDDLTEYGQYVVDGESKPRRFDWYKHRLGPVTVAATVRHAAGETDQEHTAVTQAALRGVGFVTANVDRYGRTRTSATPSGPAGSPAGSPAASASGSPSGPPSGSPSVEPKGAGDD